jgi:uncharacterized membrane protein (UPF0127 family)
MREVRVLGPRGLVLRALVPETRPERMLGFLGRSSLDPDVALLLEGTRSVHTFAMRLPISAAMLDQDLVVRSVRRMPPNRLLLPRPGVRHVLECAEGVDLRVGDQLRIVRAD